MMENGSANAGVTRTNPPPEPHVFPTNSPRNGRRFTLHHSFPPLFSGDGVLAVPLVDAPGLEGFEFLVKTSFGLGWSEFCAAGPRFEGCDHDSDFPFGAGGVELGDGSHVCTAEMFRSVDEGLKRNE